MEKSQLVMAGSIRILIIAKLGLITSRNHVVVKKGVHDAIRNLMPQYVGSQWRCAVKWKIRNSLTNSLRAIKIFS